MKIMAAASLMGMALLTGADILGRGVWNAPIYGSEELVSILAVLVVGFSLPYAHCQGSHIGVEVVVRRFQRLTRKIIKLLTDLISLGLFGVVAWRLFLYGKTLEKAGEVSLNLELPTYYVIFALGAGFVAFSLFLLRDVIHFFTKEDDPYGP